MQANIHVRFRPDGYEVEHVDLSSESSASGESRPQADPSLLTKSRYLTGLDNPREMWYESRGTLTPDLGEQWRLQQGQCVGEVARQQFPDGTFVGGPLRETYLCSNDPLFEVTVEEDGFLVRSDILRPSDAGGWILTEVKSSTLKSRPSQEDAKHDLAFQIFVLQQAGLTIDRAEIMHLNPEYVHPDQGSLFATTALGSERAEYIDTVREEAPRLAQVLSQSEPPNLWPSRDCNTCDCPETCHDLPEHSIFTLPRLHWRHMEDMLSEGRATLEEIDGHMHLKQRHANYIEAVQSGEPYVDNAEIRSLLDELEYPIHFFDFEAIDYALPKFDGTSPWQKIPFQYSLHILRENGDMEHDEYLHSDGGDPRRALTEQMLEDTEDQGSVVVYHDTFEKQRLEELQAAFPEQEGELQNLIDRLWDQAEVFKWHYIHPDQKGSWSLKTVLPLFAPDLDYGDLDIQHGMAAVVKYGEMIAEDSPSDAAEIREQLLSYCERDTYAMVEIHQSLCELVSLA